MLWVKAFHIIFVICWFAGIFYLPRLFVNHAMTTDQATSDQLKIMEYKLYRFMSIFAALSIIFGLWLVSYNWVYYVHSTWFISKFILVILLVVYHFLCGQHVKRLQITNTQYSHVYYRWFNEIPVLILFSVVILVVVKPFE